MPDKLKIWDARMFLLMDNTVGRVKGFDVKEDFIKVIDFPNVQNLKQIRDGKASFRMANFYAACKHFNITMDWFMGFTNDMYRVKAKTSGMQLLKAAVTALELEKNSIKS